MAGNLHRRQFACAPEALLHEADVVQRKFVWSSSLAVGRSRFIEHQEHFDGQMRELYDRFLADHVRIRLAADVAVASARREAEKRRLCLCRLWEGVERSTGCFRSHLLDVVRTHGVEQRPTTKLCPHDQHDFLKDLLSSSF